MTRHGNFDFDLMARLAKEAPMEFDRKRTELIQEVIASFDSPGLGSRIQSQIDSDRTAIPLSKQSCLLLAERIGLLAKQVGTALEDMRRDFE